MAATILSRALHEKGVTEDQLVGVLYLLGCCRVSAAAAGTRRWSTISACSSIDIQFRDVGERLAALESRV